jgi:hypothetical protein
MGYIGLLLNAPYKIDSMVWMMLMMMYFSLDYFHVSFCCILGYTNQDQNGEKRPKMGVTRVFEVLGV